MLAIFVDQNIQPKFLYQPATYRFITLNTYHIRYLWCTHLWWLYLNNVHSIKLKLINQSSYYLNWFTLYEILYQPLPIYTDQYFLTQGTQIGKIEETFFTGYCHHPTESSKTSAIVAYFTNYCRHLTESSRTNACDNDQ